MARSFSRLGWLGLWLQVILGAVPVMLMGYYFFFATTPAGTRGGLAIVEYLTLANLLVLVFTAFWSYRYTRLGIRMADPTKRPTESFVVNVVWTGVIASAFGMLVSMIVLLIETAHLLFYFLKMPQAGVPVVQTTSGEMVSWVSAVDMVSLVALILTLMAELIVLIFSLWLLFRTTAGSPDLADSQTTS